jgi:hypothetical protein
MDRIILMLTFFSCSSLGSPPLVFPFSWIASTIPLCDANVFLFPDSSLFPVHGGVKLVFGIDVFASRSTRFSFFFFMDFAHGPYHTIHQFLFTAMSYPRPCHFYCSLVIFDIDIFPFCVGNSAVKRLYSTLKAPGEKLRALSTSSLPI